MIRFQDSGSNPRATVSLDEPETSAANLSKLHCGSLPAEMRETAILATPIISLVSMGAFTLASNLG